MKGNEPLEGRNAGRLGRVSDRSQTGLPGVLTVWKLSAFICVYLRLDEFAFQLRATRNTPMMITPMPVMRIAFTDSPKKCQAISALITYPIESIG